jgi:hypothetical protein
VTTLSSVAIRAWRELGFSTTVAATGGSTTTVVDANTKYTTTDALKGGTAIVVRDAGGASAAPEGEYGRISAFNSGTFTFTIDAVSSAIASGDTIDLANPKIPLVQMIQAVNNGITDLGFIAGLNTSITTASDTTEYTLPVALKSDDVLDILYQGRTGNTVDNEWVSIKSQVRVEPSTAGSTALIYLPFLPSGRTVRIIYNGYHPLLTAFSSTISEQITETLATAAAIDKALTWLVSKRGNSALGTFLIQRWNDAKQTLEKWRLEKPLFKPYRKPRYFVSGNVSLDQSEVKPAWQLNP